MNVCVLCSPKTDIKYDTQCDTQCDSAIDQQTETEKEPVLYAPDPFLYNSATLLQHLNAYDSVVYDGFIDHDRFVSSRIRAERKKKPLPPFVVEEIPIFIVVSLRASIVVFLRASTHRGYLI